MAALYASVCPGPSRQTLCSDCEYVAHRILALCFTGPDGDVRALLPSSLPQVPWEPSHQGEHSLLSRMVERGGGWRLPPGVG